MSAYITQETEIRDQDCLVDALKDMKLRSGKACEPEVHKEAQSLHGYEGKARQQKAEVIIRRGQVGSASNDIGFKKNAKGNFEAIISEYDKSYYGANWMKALTKTYAVKKARKVAKQNGLEFVGQKETRNGHTQLQFRVASSGY